MDKQRLKKELIFLLVIFCFAFLLRFAYCLLFQDNILYIEQNIFGDTQSYANLARSILDGRGLNGSAFRPPVYPVFLAGVYFLFGEGYWPLRVIQIIISSFTCMLVYLLGKNCLDHRTGLIAACINSIYPFFIFFSAFTLTETLYILLLVASVFLLSRTVEQPQKHRLLASGILLGLTVLCRPSTIIFLVFLFGGLIFSPIWSGSKVKNIAILFLLAILTISPWSIRNYLTFRQFVPLTTMGGHTFWEGNNPQATGGPCHYWPEGIDNLSEVERDRYLTKATLKVIRENPSHFLKLMGIKFVRFWNILPNYEGFSSLKYNLVSMLSYGPILLTGLGGMILTRKRWIKLLILYLLIFSFTLTYMLFVGSIRYRTPIMPFFIIFSGYGVNWLYLRLAACFSKQRGEVEEK